MRAAPMIRGTILSPLSARALEMFRAYGKVRVLESLLEMLGPDQLLVEPGEEVYKAGETRSDRKDN